MRRAVILGLLLLSACHTKTTRPPDDPQMLAAAPSVLASHPVLPAVVPSPAPMVLVSGDLVHITVFRQKDLEMELRIPESGEFAYPLIGEVKAAGRSSKEVEKDIRSRLEEKYMHKASVMVTVVQFAPRMVYVLGAVQRPSGYEYQPNRRLTVLQLVSTAGGYTDRAHKEYAQLIRRKENGERELIRFSINEVEKAVAKGHVGADLELSPDDLLVIPSAIRVAYVLGQVNKPGSFELPPDTRMTVSMAVSQAGSWTKFGAIGRIQVIRQPPTGDPIKITVDLDSIINGGAEKDLELQPGDVVWVPQKSLF